MDVLVNVLGQKLSIATNMKNFVAGTQNFVRFVFNLSDEWDGLTKYAQFKQNGVAYNQMLDENNSVYLPPDIDSGTCTMILHGEDTTGTDPEHIIATTNFLTLLIGENILETDPSNIIAYHSQTLDGIITSVVEDFLGGEAIYLGKKTVSQVNALDNVTENSVCRVTDSGTINNGTGDTDDITVSANDYIKYDGEKWEILNSVLNLFAGDLQADNITVNSPQEILFISGNTNLKALLDSKQGEANVIEGVQLNGTDLTITNKKVNILVDNTPTNNSNNPVKSNGVYTALADKVDKVLGKGLSSNDYTNSDKGIVQKFTASSSRLNLEGGLLVYDDIDCASDIKSAGNLSGQGYIFIDKTSGSGASSPQYIVFKYIDSLTEETVQKSLQDYLDEKISTIPNTSESGTKNGQIALSLYDGRLYQWSASDTTWDELPNQYQTADETHYGDNYELFTATNVGDALDELALATKPVVTTSAATTVSVTPVNNGDYRYGVVSTSITVTMPQSISGAYCSCIRFTTPSTIPENYSIFPNSVIYVGDDVSNGVFTPTVNKRYTLLFDYDGDAVICYIYGRTVSAS